MTYWYLDVPAFMARVLVWWIYLCVAVWALAMVFSALGGVNEGSR